MTHIQAMLCALGAFFCWVLFDTNSKLAAQAGVSPFVIMAIFGIVGVLTTSGIAVFKQNLSLLRSRNPKAQGAVCLSAIVSAYLNIIAVKHLPLTVFYLIYFTAPLIIALISALLRHEKLTPGKIACLAIGFIGVGVVLLPRLTDNGEVIGYIAVLTAVTAFSARAIILRKIAQNNTIESLLFFTALATGIAGITGWVSQGYLAPDGKIVVVLFVASGIALLGHFLYNTALKYTISTNVAQLQYTQLLWSSILAYLIWHDVPSVNLVVGAVLIVGAGLVTARQAQKNQALQATLNRTIE
jgi:drug/metabolite transporter (DMT)-like permease